jgi:thiamine pyrophosphate-dependent acetolactate synthase large subunit-like protein
MVAVVEALGVPAVRVEAAAGVLPAAADALGRGGVRVVVVPTDRADNVDRHAEAWAAVADAVG